MILAAGENRSLAALIESRKVVHLSPFSAWSVLLMSSGMSM